MAGIVRDQARPAPSSADEAEPTRRGRVALIVTAGSSKATAARATAGSGDPPLSVGAELDAIFGVLPRPSSPPKDHVAVMPAPQRARLRWVWAALLILAALLLAAASVAFLAHTSRAPLPQSRPRSTPPRTIAVAPVVQAPIQQAQPAPAESPAATTPETPTAKPESTGHRAAAQRQAGPARRRGRCAAGATSAWCLRGAVVAADDRLRNAYAVAIRAGVDRKTLEGVRSDWSRLRRRANKDPEALIRGYGLLAQQLRAEAGRGRRR